MRSTPDIWSAYTQGTNSKSVRVKIQYDAHFILGRYLFFVMFELIGNANIEIAIVSSVRSTWKPTNDFVTLIDRQRWRCVEYGLSARKRYEELNTSLGKKMLGRTSSGCILNEDPSRIWLACGCIWKRCRTRPGRRGRLAFARVSDGEHYTKKEKEDDRQSARVQTRENWASKVRSSFFAVRRSMC
jgi:hypothetical protein